MRYEAAFLSAGEQERVHEASMRILAEVGCGSTASARCPCLPRPARWLTRSADRAPAARPRGVGAGEAPRSFVLGARNPAFDYPLPSPITRFALDGNGGVHAGLRDR